MARAPRFLVAVVTALPLAAACAGGSEPWPGTFAADDAGTYFMPGANGGAAGIDGAADGTADGAVPSGPQGPGPQDGGGDAIADGDGRAPVSCTAVTACPATIHEAGSVYGDSASTVTVEGFRSQWVRVLVVDSNSVAVSIKAKARLTSPAGANFGLVAYVKSDAVGAECATVTTSDLGTATTKELSVSWGDVPGADNTRAVTLEVRNLSGACWADTSWTLEVVGDE